MSTHSNILTWKIPWTQELVCCSPWDFPGNCCLPSSSMNLGPLGTSLKENHTTFILVCLANFTEQNVFEGHPSCSLYQVLLPF